MEITNIINWITPAGNIGRVEERNPFIFTLQAESNIGAPITFELVDGIFPDDLVLNSNGTISGNVIDMDNYVPEFQGANDEIPAIDGSDYATFGSAAAGSYECSFTVRIVSGELNQTRTFSITVINNWSSDRNQLIRRYAQAYGTDNQIFTIDGDIVNTELYIITLGWSLGDSPSLAELSWILYIQTEDKYILNFAGPLSFGDEVTF